MRMRFLLLLVLGAGCLRPAHDAPEGKSYVLALPLSGPHLLHANVMGEGAVLAVGTAVRVESVRMDRGLRSTVQRWCTRCDLTPCPKMYLPNDGRFRDCPVRSSPLYRVLLSGPAACAPPCEVRIAAWNDTLFAQRFDRIFSPGPVPPAPEGELELGLTAEAVTARVGEPDSVALEGEQEVWRYASLRCEAGVLQQRPVLELRLTNRRLVGLRRMPERDFAPEPEERWALCRKP